MDRGEHSQSPVGMSTVTIIMLLGLMTLYQFLRALLRMGTTIAIIIATLSKLNSRRHSAETLEATGTPAVFHQG